PLEPAAFGCGQFHGPCALHQHFASLSLGVLEAEKWSISLGRIDGFLHRDQKLMAALRWRADFQDQHSRLHLAGFQRTTGGPGDFVSLRKLDLKLGGIALHYS